MYKRTILISLLLVLNNYAAEQIKRPPISLQEKRVIELRTKLKDSMRAIPEMSQIISAQNQLTDIINNEKKKTKLIEIQQKIDHAKASIKDTTSKLLDEIFLLKQDPVKNAAAIKANQNQIMEIQKKVGLDKLEKEKISVQENFYENLLKLKEVQDSKNKIDTLIHTARLKVNKNPQIQAIKKQLKESK